MILDIPLVSIEFLPSLVVAWLITYFIHSTLILGSVLLAIRFVSSKTGRTREFLLKTALLGGLLSSTFQMSMVPGSVYLTLPIEMEFDVDSMDSPYVVSSNISNGSGLGDYARSVNISKVVKDGLSTYNSSYDPFLRWPDSLFLIWIAGITLAGYWYLRKWRALRGILRKRMVISDGPIYSKILELKNRAGIKRKIRLASAARSNCLFATGFGQICVSEDLISSLKDSEQQSVLAHEIAHLHRNDPVWSAFICILKIVFFFQPLNFIVFRKLQVEMEYLCDEWALKHTGNPIAMAKSLVKFALPQNQVAFVPFASNITYRKTTFIERAKRILQWENTRVSRKSAIAGIVAVLCLSVLAGGVVPKTNIIMTMGMTTQNEVVKNDPQAGLDNRPDLITFTGSLYSEDGTNLEAKLSDCTLNKKYPYDYEFTSGEGFLIFNKNSGNKRIVIDIRSTPDGGLIKSHYINGKDQNTSEEMIDKYVVELFGELLKTDKNSNGN